MALGTPAASQSGGRDGVGRLTHDTLVFVGDDSYPTGGTTGHEAFVQTALSRGVELLSATGYGDDGTDLTHLAQYDAANDTLKVYTIATGVEIANTTDLSTTTFRMDYLSR